MIINFKKSLTLSFVVLFSLLFIFSSANAQSRGSITGRVTDATSGEYLPGANVIIEDTNFGDASDREGVYIIKNVPPGSYTLKVSYIGYEPYSADVSIDAGERTMHDVELEVSYVEMEQVVVEGMRQGQAKALSQQRMAVNIKNVVAQEQMQRFPDENTADVLKRVPGVYVANSNGEGRYAYIRGTSPKLSNVTVDGQKISTNRVEERFPQLDIIGASQLASVEVIKAITPDMDGEAIGGAINLKTRSAFDFPDRRVDITLGGGYADIDNKGIGHAKISYNDRFGAKDNIGFSLTLNYDTKVKGADGVEFSWDDAEDINDNEIPYALEEWDLRDYYTKRIRKGIGGGIEYRLNDNHQWYVRGVYSKFDDDEVRGRWRLEAGDYLNPEGTLIAEGEGKMEHKDRIEELEQTNISFGGLHKFGDAELDYTVAYSYANEIHDPQLESEWELDEEFNMAYNLSEPKAPKWRMTSLPAWYEYDPSNYDFDGLDYRTTFANDENYTGEVNFKMPYSLSGLPAELKLGVKGRYEEKDRDEDRYKVKWRGDDITLSQFVSDRQDTEFLDGEYIFGPVPNADKVMDFFNRYRNTEDMELELRYDDSEGQYYVAKENIYAYYAMTTVNMGKFKFLGGFRHEFTMTDYLGTELFYDQDGDFQSYDRVTEERDYNNFLPMAHVRYMLNPMTNLRAAFTRTLSRPNYWNLAPYLWVFPEDEEMERGNPDLKPTLSNNIDLMFEHYFQGIGLASGGLFYKQLDDIIFVRQTKISGGVYDDYEVEEPINGGSATLYGFELAWSQELSFLPGFLSGFGVYANYMHTWSETDLTGREGFLPGQAGDVANFALSYEKNKFSLRLSAMYQSDFIEEVGKDENWDEIMDEHFQIDFSGTYDILPNVKAYLEVVNINNAPEYLYVGDESRPLQREFYSWWSKAGFKFRF